MRKAPGQCASVRVGVTVGLESRATITGKPRILGQRWNEGRDSKPRLKQYGLRQTF